MTGTLGTVAGLSLSASSRCHLGPVRATAPSGEAAGLLDSVPLVGTYAIGAGSYTVVVRESTDRLAGGVPGFHVIEVPCGATAHGPSWLREADLALAPTVHG